MAKPASAIGKAKKAAAFQRRLDRGAKKLARRAHRISLHHHNPLVGGHSGSAPEHISGSGAHSNTINLQKEHAA